MSYQYYFKESSESDKLIVLFHGTGGDEMDLVSIVEYIDPKASILSLRGNENENGLLRFFKRFGLNQIDLENLKENASKMIEFLKEKFVELNLENKKKIALGYSNGANFIAALEQLNSTLFDGIILSHGNLYLEDKLKSKKELKVFVSMGDNDQMISPQKTQRMIKLFEDQGCDVEVLVHSSGHQLTHSEIIAMKKWVETQI